ncbi:hypothetical protein CcaCcLH18_07892 [Colletotrichum camelliae]|nr:hypothetical protein CcaCcLH18_07892 [Colletotrichum camelliae]
MKKLSVKKSTSVFGRPSECGDRRRTRGEGGLRKGAKPTISHRRNKAPGRKGGQKKIPSIVKGTSMKVGTATDSCGGKRPVYCKFDTKGAFSLQLGHYLEPEHDRTPDEIQHEQVQYNQEFRGMMLEEVRDLACLMPTLAATLEEAQDWSSFSCRPIFEAFVRPAREEWRTGTRMRCFSVFFSKPRPTVLSDAVTDADSGTDGARNDTKGTDVRRYVFAQTDTVVRQKLPKEHVANKH